MTIAPRMLHTVDPKQALLDEVGDLAGMEVFGAEILVAIYKRPEKTAGGIILADTTRAEDKWQGKVGLVLKKGPAAFKDDDRTKFYGVDVEVGDWVYFRPSDGWFATVGNTEIRQMQDVHIRGRIPRPDFVW